MSIPSQHKLGFRPSLRAIKIASNNRFDTLVYHCFEADCSLKIERFYHDSEFPPRVTVEIRSLADREISYSINGGCYLYDTLVSAIKGYNEVVRKLTATIIT